MAAGRHVKPPRPRLKQNAILIHATKASGPDLHFPACANPLAAACRSEGVDEREAPPKKRGSLRPSVRGVWRGVSVTPHLNVGAALGTKPCFGVHCVHLGLYGNASGRFGGRSKGALGRLGESFGGMTGHAG